MPHQSAIYKALFGVWVYYFHFYVLSEDDAHHSEFVFVPVSLTLAAAHFYFRFDRLECSKANVWSLHLNSRGDPSSGSSKLSYV